MMTVYLVNVEYNVVSYYGVRLISEDYNISYALRTTTMLVKLQCINEI